MWNSKNVYLSLNSHRHPEGTVIQANIGSSPVAYTVTSANDSFIRATATLPNIVELNGTTVTCDGNTRTLSLIQSSKCHQSCVY